MGTYEFQLYFSLPDANEDPAAYVDALYEAGCDDALVGAGQHGSVGLDFAREAESAEDAITSAIGDVDRAIPGARLIEAAPDLVGIAEVAEVLECTRQNATKLVRQPRFPAPVHIGKHTSLWHLADVLEWAELDRREVSEALHEVARTACLTNINVQRARYGSGREGAA